MLGTLAFLLAVALVPPSVSSAASHPFLGTFCEPSGLGTAPCTPNFLEPEGLAIDQSSGDLLVIDSMTGTVSRYHSDGTPSNFTALGTNVIDAAKGGGAKGCGEEPSSCDLNPSHPGLSFGSPGEVQVAVDDSGGASDGNVYVTQTTNHLVDVFASDGSFLGELTESNVGAFGEICGVGTDPAGTVYLAEYGEPEGEIHVYEPSGAFPVNGDNTVNFAAPRPCTLAVGVGPSVGFVFVTTLEGQVTKFDATTGEEKYVVASGPNITVTVNPASGRLYVASGNPFAAEGAPVEEYDVSGVSAAALLSSIVPVSAGWGVAVEEASANVYLSERANPQIEVWGPAVAVPVPVTEAPTELTPTEATLNGSVNPEGLPLTECFFEYDTAPYPSEGAPHGETIPCEDPDAEEVGEGASSVAVHGKVSNLHPGTTYHFRLVASNAKASAQGEDKELLTPGPSIRGVSVSQITATGAKVSGEVNPRGEATSFEVQYVTEAQFDETE